MTAIADYITRLLVYVRAEDADQLDTAEKTACVAAAVSEHSKYRPQVKYEETSGDGGFDYAVPADWVEGLSSVLSVEYPMDDTSRTQSWVDADNHTLVNDGGSWKIRFLADTPSATETYRLEYTTVHVLDAVPTDTILSQDFNAVCMLAGAHACASLAAKYAGSSESTLSTDITSLATRRMEFHALEKDLKKMYFEAMGIDPKKTGTKAAMSDGDMDPKFARQVDYMTHPRRYR